MLSFVVSLPLWLIAILFKNTLIAGHYIASHAWKFWSDPPKRRVGYYYADSAPRKDREPSQLTIKRGSGERFFQH